MLENASDDFDLVTMAATSDADVAKVFGVKKIILWFFIKPLRLKDTELIFSNKLWTGESPKWKEK